MKFKPLLIGQSLIWTGMVVSHCKGAWAEAIAVPPPEPSSNPECCSPQRLAIQPDEAIGESQTSLPANPQPIHISPPETGFENAETRLQRLEFSRSRSRHAYLRWLRQGTLPPALANASTTAKVFEFSEFGIQLPSSEQAETSTSNPEMDPELGQLQLQDITPTDPDLGRLRLQEQPLVDPELGRLRLQEETPLVEADEAAVFLLGNVSVFKSDNILLDDFDPVDDQVFRGGLTLFAAPSVGPRTYLFGSLGGNLSVYDDLSELNYSDFELSAGVRQVLWPSTYADLSWTHQQFFSLVDGDRFLSDHSLRLALSHREQLTSQLYLDGYYQLRFSFTDPSDRSRIFNQFGLTLGYVLQSDLDVGLNYQWVLTDFTQQDRHDSYHEITAQLNYNLSPNSRVSVFAGASFGESTESFIDFDSSLLGIVFSTNVSLF